MAGCVAIKVFSLVAGCGSIEMYSSMAGVVTLFLSKLHSFTPLKLIKTQILLQNQIIPPILCIVTHLDHPGFPHGLLVILRVAIGPGGPYRCGLGPGLGQIFGENSYIGPARLAQDLGWVLLGARRACPPAGGPGPRQSSASLRSQESGTQALRDQFTSHSQPHTTQATHSSDPRCSTICSTVLLA
jgi:hypothetical protein